HLDTAAIAVLIFLEPVGGRSLARLGQSVCAGHAKHCKCTHCHSSLNSAFRRACLVPLRGCSGMAMPCSLPIRSTVAGEMSTARAMLARITPRAASSRIAGARASRAALPFAERALFRRSTVSCGVILAERLTGLGFAGALGGKSPRTFACHVAAPSSRQVMFLMARRL